jgi:hypothetical protein
MSKSMSTLSRRRFVGAAAGVAGVAAVWGIGSTATAVAAEGPAAPGGMTLGGGLVGVRSGGWPGVLLVR